MDGDVMNLIAVSFAAVIVVLIAIKIKDMDSGYGVILSMAGCVMVMYFVLVDSDRSRII